MGVTGPRMMRVPPMGYQPHKRPGHLPMRVSESYPGAPDADGTWYRAQAYHLSQMSWADLQKAAGVYLPPEMKVIWYSLCIAEYDRRTLLRPAAPTAGLLTPASGPGTHNEDLLIASEP